MIGDIVSVTHAGFDAERWRQRTSLQVITKQVFGLRRFTVGIDWSYPGQSSIFGEAWTSSGWVEAVSLYCEDPSVMVIVKNKKTPANPKGLIRFEISMMVAELLEVQMNEMFHEQG